MLTNFMHSNANSPIVLQSPPLCLCWLLLAAVLLHLLLLVLLLLLAPRPAGDHITWVDH
jgi:hypothetical protein